ncbi:MAG: hypothetical protein WAT34_13715 [Chitinophagaceae bacterium]|nr:hypothetical protein [Chitinophagaceae bacterium]
MKRGWFLLLSVFLYGLEGQGQKPEEVLARWSETTPIEKVYLHFDRDNYLAGETAWFKAYLYSDYQPDTISTSLYVELLNESSVILSRKILPVFFGNTTGQFELPDSLSSGSYLVRAYSPTMLRVDADFIYKRRIYIYGKKNNTVLTRPKEKMTRIEFFPEGGNIVNGFENTIAFKATDENGLPATISGILKNENGKELTSLSTYHDGMGMFSLMQEEKERYFVTINGDTTAKKYYLPEKIEKGISVTIIPHPQGNFFEIHQRTNDPAYQAAYMIGQMQHHLVFRKNFTSTNEEIQGVINTKDLHSGILQVTFFNKNGIPLAERLCFVNNKEYVQPAELLMDTIQFSRKAKNRFRVLLKDTVIGTISVAITDPEYDLLPARQENIFSTLLLTADLKGYVHNPAYYFSGDNDSVQTALDLVMMTNGWRRFRWNALSEKSFSENRYVDLSYITLAGKVSLRDMKKPYAEKPLLLLLLGADSARSMQMINTDKQGMFRLDSMLFFGTTRIFFSDIRGKKSQYIDVNLSGDSLNRAFFLPALESKPPVLNSDLVTPSLSKLAYDYEAISKANGTLLEGITLKVKKKTLLQEMEEKYVSGMFAGDANKTIDLVNSNDADVYQNIFDYLQLRVPSLSVSNEGFEYSIYYRQGFAVSSLGNIPMILYLNEIETDANVIANIPGNQVAMVKIFGSFAGATGNGAGGVLAIYTKQGADITSSNSAADIKKYTGYSLIKDFYAPDYSVNLVPPEKADHRITLDWRPTISVNHINPGIPVSFYNNDRSKKFKVIVEGMTLTGKMVCIEKIISFSDKKPF